LLLRAPAALLLAAALAGCAAAGPAASPPASAPPAASAPASPAPASPAPASPAPASPAPAASAAASAAAPQASPPGKEAAPKPSASPAASAPAASPAKKPNEAAPPAPQSAASPAASPPASAKPEAEAREVTLSVRGNAKWGTIVPAEKVALQDKDTVADVLVRVLKKHRLAYEKRGSGAFFYIVGIDGLYEMDDGPTSGWKYYVNGKAPDIGAGAYKLKAGDTVEWVYVSEDEQAAQGKASAP
jgi:hypothetical protein